MKAELVPENGDPPIPIVRDVTVLGRHEDCDVVIEHSSLSKRHCLLVKTDGLLVIRDLATTNGTKVKGQRVRWAALLPEDRVSFGGLQDADLSWLGRDALAVGTAAGTNGGAGTARTGRDAARGSRSLSGRRRRPRSFRRRRPRRALPSSFPEPSHDGTAAAEWEDTAYAPETSRKGRRRGARVAQRWFRDRRGHADAGKGRAGVFEGGFELVEDDDDDIIELD